MRSRTSRFSLNLTRLSARQQTMEKNCSLPPNLRPGHLGNAPSRSLIRANTGEQIDRPCCKLRPPSLGDGTEYGAVASIKVVVRHDIIAPVRVFLKFLVSPYTGRRPCSSRKKIL